MRSHRFALLTLAVVALALTVIASAYSAAVPGALTISRVDAATVQTDWRHTLQVVANVKAKPPGLPVVYLLGDSVARECVTSEEDWAAAVRDAGGPATLTYDLGSRNRSIAQDLRLIAALPEVPSIVFIGIDVDRFTAAPSSSTVKLPVPSEPLPAWTQHRFSASLSLARKRSLLRAWMTRRYPVFRRNYAYNLAKLEKLVKAAKAKGLHPVLLDLPRNTAVTGSALDAPIARYKRSCRALAADHDIPWVDFVAAAGLRRGDFHDLRHLIRAGRAKWQRLLAARTAALLKRYGMVTPTPSPSPTADFQPSAPYYATFFYPWYRNIASDGAYSYWQDQGNTPPTTWFGHYLPDIDPSRFDPASELYSSQDYDTFRWQVGKMAEARQEVAITSWFGQGTKQDVSVSTYLNDFMKRPDNPYPNLRFCLYYEQEGFGDPAVSRLVNDLAYIKDRYAASPFFLRVGGKPVIFVYGDATDGAATSKRWKDANAQVGKAFYYVLKVYPGYASDPNQPSSWHQYGPSSRFGSHGRYSTYVSPGFWKDAAGETARLGRDLSAFSSAVTAMVTADTTWKLVETWNEWGEGSSVEPGRQTLIDPTGREALDPHGTPFGNSYVDVLAARLPALEEGTGVGTPPHSR
jgi:Glycosyl hydrolase family 99